MTPAEFRSAVSQEMHRRYRITWADADGSDEPLERALARRETPEAFVAAWGEKYGLSEREREPRRRWPV